GADRGSADADPDHGLSSRGTLSATYRPDYVCDETDDSRRSGLLRHAGFASFKTLTCSTRRSLLARTSIRMPSRSAVSPGSGTWPSHSVTSPPTVVDSSSSSGVY